MIVRLLGLLCGLVLTLACATKPASSSAQAADAADADSDFPKDWLDQLPPDDAPVTPDEARALVLSTFATIDQKIFDPTYFSSQRASAREALLERCAHEAFSREALATAIDDALKQTGMSHLRFLRPAQMRKLEAQMASSTTATPDATKMVAASVEGDVGVVRISTFLVPAIQKADVDAAFAQVAQQKTWLLDLRGNGGGSTSSTVYVLEHVLPPDMPVSQVQVRSGVGRATPFVQHGPLADDVNVGSDADIALQRKEGFVQWRTGSGAHAAERVVYALVDDHCGSSCDAVAAALKEHGAARLLGAKTQGGLLASSLFRSTWKGHGVLVAEGMVKSAKGNVIEGHGVEPDVAIAACAEHQDEACWREALATIAREAATPH